MAWLHSGHRFGCYIPLADLVVNQNVVKVGNGVEMQGILDPVRDPGGFYRIQVDLGPRRIQDVISGSGFQ